MGHYNAAYAKMSPMPSPAHEDWTAQYDYTSGTWRMIKRTSSKRNIAEDIDANRCKLSDLTGTTYADIPQHCALFGAIACHAQTPEDFADARYWLGGIPAELKRRMWDSLPDAVKRGLREVETQEREAA